MFLRATKLGRRLASAAPVALVEVDAEAHTGKARARARARTKKKKSPAVERALPPTGKCRLSSRCNDVDGDDDANGAPPARRRCCRFVIAGGETVANDAIEEEEEEEEEEEDADDDADEGVGTEEVEVADDSKSDGPLPPRGRPLHSAGRRWHHRRLDEGSDGNRLGSEPLCCRTGPSAPSSPIRPVESLVSEGGVPSVKMKDRKRRKVLRGSGRRDGLVGVLGTQAKVATSSTPPTAADADADAYAGGYACKGGEGRVAPLGEEEAEKNKKANADVVDCANILASLPPPPPAPSGEVGGRRRVRPPPPPRPRTVHAKDKRGVDDMADSGMDRGAPLNVDAIGWGEAKKATEGQEASARSDKKEDNDRLPLFRSAERVSLPPPLRAVLPPCAADNCAATKSTVIVRVCCASLLFDDDGRVAANDAVGSGDDEHGDGNTMAADAKAFSEWRCIRPGDDRAGTEERRRRNLPFLHCDGIRKLLLLSQGGSGGGGEGSAARSWSRRSPGDENENTPRGGIRECDTTMEGRTDYPRHSKRADARRMCGESSSGWPTIIAGAAGSADGGCRRGMKPGFDTDALLLMGPFLFEDEVRGRREALGDSVAARSRVVAAEAATTGASERTTSEKKKPPPSTKVATDEGGGPWNVAFCKHGKSCSDDSDGGATTSSHGCSMMSEPQQPKNACTKFAAVAVINNKQMVLGSHNMKGFMKFTEAAIAVGKEETSGEGLQAAQALNIRDRSRCDCVAARTRAAGKKPPSSGAAISAETAPCIDEAICKGKSCSDDGGGAGTSSGGCFNWTEAPPENNCLGGGAAVEPAEVKERMPDSIEGRTGLAEAAVSSTTEETVGERNPAGCDCVAARTRSAKKAESTSSEAVSCDEGSLCNDDAISKGSKSCSSSSRWGCLDGYSMMNEAHPKYNCSVGRATPTLTEDKERVLGGQNIEGRTDLAETSMTVATEGITGKGLPAAQVSIKKNRTGHDCVAARTRSSGKRAETASAVALETMLGKKQALGVARAAGKASCDGARTSIRGERNMDQHGCGDGSMLAHLLTRLEVEVCPRAANDEENCKFLGGVNTSAVRVPSLKDRRRGETECNGIAGGAGSAKARPPAAGDIGVKIGKQLSTQEMKATENCPGKGNTSVSSKRSAPLEHNSSWQQEKETSCCAESDESNQATGGTKEHCPHNRFSGSAKPVKGQLQRRKTSCRRCKNCRQEDCGDCKSCCDKKKFGGPNKLKQRCKLKGRCLLFVSDSETKEIFPTLQTQSQGMRVMLGTSGKQQVVHGTTHFSDEGTKQKKRRGERNSQYQHMASKASVEGEGKILVPSLLANPWGSHREYSDARYSRMEDTSNKKTDERHPATTSETQQHLRVEWNRQQRREQNGDHIAPKQVAWEWQPVEKGNDDICIDMQKNSVRRNAKQRRSTRCNRQGAVGFTAGFLSASLGAGIYPQLFKFLQFAPPGSHPEDNRIHIKDMHCRFEQPTSNLLIQTHSVLSCLLPNGECESLPVVQLAARYHDYWRPKQVRAILLAESHVFTDEESATKGPKLDISLLRNEAYSGPTDFLSLVYCLSYGEDKAFCDLAGEGVYQITGNKGTPQFWSLLAACARGVHHEANVKHNGQGAKALFAADLLKGGGLSVSDRLTAKHKLLQELQEKGIWLLDTSIVGWYIQQATEYRRSKTSGNIHRVSRQRPPKEYKEPTLIISWEGFTKHLVRKAAKEGHLRIVVPIGKEVGRALTKERLMDAVKVEGKARAGVTECFPAPNAWIKGGYGECYKAIYEEIEKVLNV